MERVFAAGDVTAFPVKQGGIATQQADAVAATIAAELEGGEEPRPSTRSCAGRCGPASSPSSSTACLTGGHGDSSIISDQALWEHEGKIVGEHLAPFLDSLATTATARAPAEAVARAPGTLSRVMMRR